MYTKMYTMTRMVTKDSTMQYHILGFIIEARPRDPHGLLHVVPNVVPHDLTNSPARQSGPSAWDTSEILWSSSWKSAASLTSLSSPCSTTWGKAGAGGMREAIIRKNVLFGKSSNYPTCIFGILQGAFFKPYFRQIKFPPNFWFWSHSPVFLGKCPNQRKTSQESQNATLRTSHQLSNVSSCSYQKYWESF